MRINNTEVTSLVSVIVPIYNQERYLEQCVKSLLHQTYPYLEIILVNNGSKDRSGAICKKFARQDRRVRGTAATQDSMRRQGNIYPL